MPPSTQPPKLYINHLPEYDWLIALEFGRVDDAQPPENWHGVSESFGFLRDGEDGRPLGFKVLEFSEFDAEATEVAAIWQSPRFDAPQLGLTNAVAGEVALAADALLAGQSTVNRDFFREAISSQDEDPEEALGLWLACLWTGDSMAHFALGYTLYDLGRYREAYRHLRYYTEIAPAYAWNWCWLGKAAEEIGQIDEACAAYERALELEAAGDDETEAAERLEALRKAA